MAKTIITTCTCDICDREKAESHSFFYDRRMDAAGDMDDLYYEADLCPMHFRELVRKHGEPGNYTSYKAGRGEAMSYGSRVKSWIEMQQTIWAKMSGEERALATKIEQARGKGTMADTIMINTEIGMRLTGIPDPVTGGVMLRVDDIEDGEVMGSAALALDMADAVKLGGWLLGLDAMLAKVKAANPHTPGYFPEKYASVAWAEGVDAVGDALKGGGE